MHITNTPTLLDHYLEILAQPVGPVLEQGTRRARAGKNTRGTFRQAGSAYRNTSKTWHAFCAAPPDQVWAWSDLHLNHANILHYTTRPMLDVDTMNDALLDAAQIVPHDHWLLFGGDVSFKYDHLADWLAQCPGKKVLILGNHDKAIAHRWAELGFDAVSPVLYQALPQPVVSPLANTPIDTLWWTHYPLPVNAIPAGVLNIHGHTHDHWLNGPRLNLSVERQDFRPRRLSELLVQPRPENSHDDGDTE